MDNSTTNCPKSHEDQCIAIPSKAVFLKSRQPYSHKCHMYMHFSKEELSIYQNQPFDDILLGDQ